MAIGRKEMPFGVLLRRSVNLSHRIPCLSNSLCWTQSGVKKNLRHVRGILTDARLFDVLNKRHPVSDRAESILRKPMKSIVKSDQPSAEAQKVSRRQAKFSRAIHEFVDYLLHTETDVSQPPFVFEIRKVEMAPDLRRARIYWTLGMMHPTAGLTELPAQAKETKMMSKYLHSRTKWIRGRVTMHMRSKYSAVIEFRHHIE